MSVAFGSTKPDFPQFFLSIFSGRVALKNRSTIFTLGSRGSVLTSELEEPVIVPHAAQKSEKKVRESMATLKQNVYC